MSTNAADQARKYLQEKEIPVLFESLMTALMYHKPDDPVDFMLRGLWQVKNDPSVKVSWDMFIDTPPPPVQPSSRAPSASARRMANARASLTTTNEETVRRTPPPKPTSRPPTAGPNVEATPLPDVPIVILLGGPGGRKSVVAEDVVKELAAEGQDVAHVSVPNAIRQALEKYRHTSEWQNAALKYEAGQQIPDGLALNVVKAELSKRRGAKLIVLDGYPRTLHQVAEFEREVKRPDMAIIIDFDEDTLRKDLDHRELNENIISSRLHEYKNHTLPAAKHYDDALLLQLIAGEQTSEKLVEQFKDYVKQVLKGPASTANNVNYNVGAVNGDRLPPRDVPVVVVIGAPGSLKGEYCRRLVKRYDGFVHLSMGELLKERAAVGDPEGQEIGESLEKGELVPNAPCRELIFKAMRENPSSWGFILEGYPRELSQAEEFETYVDRTDMVLLIDCTEDFCLTNLRERFDDSADDFGRQRIATFKQHTLPMLKHYDEKGKLRVVEGDRDVDEVFQDVVQALDGVFIPQGGDQ